MPKSEHSAFGNFPASHMPKKTPDTKAEINTAEAEKTFASTKARKYITLFFLSDTRQIHPKHNILFWMNYFGGYFFGV